MESEVWRGNAGESSGPVSISGIGLKPLDGEYDTRPGLLDYHAKVGCRDLHVVLDAVDI